jgi:hypothetical protein
MIEERMRMKRPFGQCRIFRNPGKKDDAPILRSYNFLIIRISASKGVSHSEPGHLLEHIKIKTIPQNRLKENSS